MISQLFAAAAAAVRPDPVVTVSQWADANRVLDGSSASEPGPYRTDRTPYAREIMDRFGADDPCEIVVFVKCAQIGGSEIFNNAIGYFVDASPGPILLVEPTVETSKRYSKQRIAPMIAASPRLRDKVSDPRERDAGNTMLVKEFPGGVLIITGGNSAAGLRSMPIRRVLFDEVDSYPANLDGEGDPVKLGEQRTKTFAGRKVGLISTPLVRGTSRIERAFEKSDRRRYFVPCPHCGAEQFLKWSRVEWSKTVDAVTGIVEHKPESAIYRCEHCDRAIENRHKTRMLRAGVWRPTAPGDGGRTVGYHLSALYSPVGWFSWADLVREWLDAQGDPQALQVFVNTKLGETWDPLDGDKVDEHELLARCEPFDGVDLPPEIAVVTAGIDVQDDRLEIEIVGWGAKFESWSLDYVVIGGDPSAGLDVAGGVWAGLDELLATTYRHPCGADLPIVAACVDTGGHNTQPAYAYCRARVSRRVWAIKGVGGPGRPIWPKKPSKNAKGGRLDLYPIGVDAAKEQLYGRLRVGDPGPGFCHFPVGRSFEYFQGLTCERPVRKYRRGHVKVEWQKPDRARNEPLDCRVYATAALQGWLATGRRLESALDKVRPRRDDRKSDTAPAAPVKRGPSPTTGRARGGWFR